VPKHRIKGIGGRLKSFIRRLVVILLAAPIVLVILFKFIDPPFWGWEISRTLFPPHGYPARIEQTWRPLHAISKNVPLAVIASEDQRFPQHWGLDIHALIAVVSAAGRDGPERGASTITQQTAKNVFLFPSQTYVRKAYELYIAFLLELIWGKNRIMEVYLNVIEFGPGIYGVEAASQHYFGISASKLTRHQSAQLAVVLPNPYHMKPAPMTDYVSQRTQWVLRQMNNIGVITL
jgi:monofunctional glycosyltransferase